MAIYVKAVKKSETKDFVTYSYGDNPNNLEGVIEFSLADLSWKILKVSSEKKGKFLAVAIIPRIIIYYKENGMFPEVIYKES